MKRFSLLFFFAAIYCNAFAQISRNILQLDLGDASILNKDVTMNYVLDFDATTWELKEDFKEWCGKDYEKRIKLISQTFCTEFNKASSKVILSNEQQDTPYTILIKTRNFRRSAMSSLGRFYIRLTATIEIIDNSTNETICRLSACDFRGGKDYIEDERLKKCYKNLAKALAKRKICRVYTKKVF